MCIRRDSKHDWIGLYCDACVLSDYCIDHIKELIYLNVVHSKLIDGRYCGVEHLVTMEILLLYSCLCSTQIFCPYFKC